MNIKAIIIEDEFSAREALKRYLKKYCPQVELIGEASDAREGIETIRELKPQLVFLDVEMPFGNAFDVLDHCQDISFETIFVTAYAEYSLRALNLSASYYLLKPISIEELIVAVNKVYKQIIEHEVSLSNKVLIENMKESQPCRQQVVLPTLEGFEVVRIKNIIRLQGNGNFTDIYLSDKSKKMVCRFLKYFEENLSYPFVRIHKSHIVNVDYIKSYHKSSGGYVVLEDDNEIEISAAYKEDFLRIFK